MRAWGIVVAAGRGDRLGIGDPKAFRILGGKPMIAYSLEAFESVRFIEGVVMVVPAGWEDRAVHLARGYAPALRVRAVTGGATRQASVAAAFAAREETSVFIVHDAARPLVDAAMIERAVDGLAEADGAVCAIVVSDTLKRAPSSLVEQTVARDDLWRAQTPQAFTADVLRECHERAAADGYEATDDAGLLERYGYRVAVVAGDERNIKITTRADLQIAEVLITGDLAGSRTGIGYDAHALVEGRPLVLGGVTIPSDRGLAGHSDADVLLHAICDAIVGAAALGDLGEHFPSSDPRWEGAASSELARACVGMANDAGFSIANIDATVVLERPALSQFRDEMRKSIAGVLGIDIQQISVKATTTDGIGGIGRGEGGAAVAVVRLEAR